MNENILTAEHIRKRYGNKMVLRDLSIQVKQGDIYGLAGKNGSGKTTLLCILTGLIQAYDGRVLIKKTGDQIAAVINTPSLFLNMSAFENMKEQAILLGIRNKTAIKQVLNMIELDGCDKKQVKNFSLGMTQRLKLGMALLGNPDILILDEPMNGLDPDGIAFLRTLLRRLNRENGMTIVISSHILSELSHIATRVGILHDGGIVEEISVQDVLQNGGTLEAQYMQYTRGGNYQ